MPDGQVEREHQTPSLVEHSGSGGAWPSSLHLRRTRSAPCPPRSSPHTRLSLPLACRRRGMLQESIDFHEQVLAIMDESIQVYSPELLQNRISILRCVCVSTCE